MKLRSLCVLAVIVCISLFIACTEKPTEPVRDNPNDGLNPDFIPQILNITVGYGGNQAENPVATNIIVSGAAGAIELMQIGQVDNSGASLNATWQNFDSSATLNFTGSFGTKWLAAKVRALNGNESAVFYKSFTLGMNAPSNLSAQVDELSISLTWDDNSSVETGYKIERKEGAGGSYSQVGTVSKNVETYTDSGLTGGTTYYYRVCAYNGSTNSGYSNEASATTSYQAGYTQTFPLGTTGLTIEMVWIPPGSFMLGRYSGEQGSYSNEDPQHLVTLDYGFWLGKYEVTQSQWEAVTGSNPSQNYGVGDDYPVYYVSWNDIHNDFLETLNNQTVGEPWRLPSESEWEYACRAGTTTRYYWGDDLSETQIGNYAWYSGNSGITTHTVGTKLPNTWNLYDMSGNVWEWVEDWYHSNYNGAPTNGDPWLDPPGSARIFRGGSWDNSSTNARCATRYGSNPSNQFSNYGFRCAITP